MRPHTALLKTLTGKTVVALLLVTGGVGAAAAAGAEVPILSTSSGSTGSTGASGDEDDGATDAGEESSGEESSGEESSGEESSGEESSGDDGSADEESSTESESGDDDSVDEDSADEDEGTDVDNHGQAVSTFARENPLELEGCEKGQATAAVARGDVDPATVTLDELSPYLAKCGDADDEDESGEDESAEGESDDDDLDGEEGSEDDWKTLRDEGRETVHLAQQAFVEACGDDGEAAESDESVGDAEMSDECRSLHDAAKDAREAWKLEWKTARDDAKGRAVEPTDAGGADDPVEVTEPTDPAPSESTGKPDKTGKPDHAGKPEQSGKPERTGKPEKSGKP